VRAVKLNRSAIAHQTWPQLLGGQTELPKFEDDQAQTSTALLGGRTSGDVSWMRDAARDELNGRGAVRGAAR